MSTVLLLARDFIERLSNPAYGPAVNEEYGLRFGHVLAREEFERQFDEEIRALEDPDAFTSHGWLWLLGWARAKSIPMDDRLLAALFEQSASVFVRTLILDVAVRGDELDAQWPFIDLREFPDPFLATVLAAVIRPRGERPQGRDEGDLREPPVDRLHRLPATSAAELTLVSLLQSGMPRTLSAATVLLQHPWEGQKELNRFFWTLAGALDEQTRQEWLERVHPLPRGTEL